MKQKKSKSEDAPLEVVDEPGWQDRFSAAYSALSIRRTVPAQSQKKSGPKVRAAPLKTSLTIRETLKNDPAWGVGIG